jgi:hypothetical protein
MAKAQVTAVGDVAELVISAPPLNLFDGQLAADLEAALDELAVLTREGAARAVLQIARDHGVAAADAVTPREAGQIFATRDLPAGLASVLEQGRARPYSRGR